MKTRIVSSLWSALLAAFLLISCDEHFEEDFSWHSWQPGMVYCTNGDVAAYDKCVADGNTPEAVLFYVDYRDETAGIAYAVSLKDTGMDDVERNLFRDRLTRIKALAATVNSDDSFLFQQGYDMIRKEAADGYSDL